MLVTGQTQRSFWNLVGYLRRLNRMRRARAQESEYERSLPGVAAGL